MIPFILVTEVILIPVDFDKDGKPTKVEEEFVPVRVNINEIIAYAPTIGQTTSAVSHITMRHGREYFITETADQLDTVVSTYFGVDEGA